MNPAGYSGTPLVRKLGLKDGQAAIFENFPDHYYRLLSPLPDIKILDQRNAASADFIHLFCADVACIESFFPGLKIAMKLSGMFWISWPKKSSKIASELDGNIVRRYGLINGLVDVKVCAIDDDWSGLKFMYRLKDRQ